MPLYEYICQDCGPFTEMEKMARASEPMPCPSCEQLAPRGISAPFLANMDPNNRVAHQRNELSSHEPKVGNVKNTITVTATAIARPTATRARARG